MNGDDLVRPLNAPPGGALFPGIQPGSTGVIAANQVIIFGPTGVPTGLFLYQPGTTPGLGNPPVEWISNSTTDPFGNPLVTSGIVTFNATFNAVAYLSGGFANFNAGGFAPGTIGAPGDTLTITSIQTTAGDTTASVVIRSALQAGNSAGGVTLPGTVIATAGTAASPSHIITDTWHPFTLINGWAAAASPNAAPQYRLTIGNELELAGYLDGVAATASQFATLAAPYIPATKQVAGAVGATGNVTANHAPFAQVTTAGAVTISGTAALPAAGVFTLAGCILPLDLT